MDKGLEKFLEDFVDFDSSWGRWTAVCVRISMLIGAVAIPIIWSLKHL